MTVLVDHDLEGYARQIWGVLTTEGNVERLPESGYRIQCAHRLMERVLYLEQ